MSDCSVHYMATTDLWATPQDLFDRLNAEFQFTTDVCALPQNAKCERFFSPRESCTACGGTGVLILGTDCDFCHFCDGLKQRWSGACFMNPPFRGRGTIDPWIEKAYHSACEGSATVVCLVPARTGSPWFWNYCSKGEVRFLKGKVKFIGAGKSVAPFNSAIVIFHAHLDPGGVVRWVTNFRDSSKSDQAHAESGKRETTINV